MTQHDDWQTRETVTRPQACCILNVGAHRLWELIRSGHLTTSGTGHSTRITTESLNAEVARRRNFDATVEKSGNSRQKDDIGKIGRQNFFSGPIDTSDKGSKNGAMQVMNRPSVELLPVSRAAARLAISDKLLSRAIESGQLPAVTIGSRRWINSGVLAKWAQGSIVGADSADTGEGETG